MYTNRIFQMCVFGMRKIQVANLIYGLKSITKTNHIPVLYNFQKTLVPKNLNLLTYQPIRCMASKKDSTNDESKIKNTDKVQGVPYLTFIL